MAVARPRWRRCPVERLAAKVKVRYTPPDEHPPTNFDERDLFRFAEATGFIEIALDYRAELTALPLDTTDWDVLMRMSGNPLDPTIGEDIRAALTSAEQAEFEAHLRPLVESGQPRLNRSAHVFLCAFKPPCD